MSVIREKTFDVVRCDEVRLELSAVECFDRLCRRPGAFFLDSPSGFGRLGRWSLLGAEPFMTLTARGRTCEITTRDSRTLRRGNPFRVLGDLLRRFRAAPGDVPVPFAAGGVGFLGYDLKDFVERLPSRAARDLDVPEMHFAFYDSVLAFDHETGRAFLTGAGSGLSAKARKSGAEGAAGRLRAMLADKPDGLPTDDEFPRASGLESNFTRDDYVRTIRRTKDYIAAGDIFQANISQRFHTRWAGPAPALYRRLRAVNPAPFAAYVGFPGGHVLSSSPERFLKVTGRRVETRPIKGTRRRTGNPALDAVASAELLASAKDNAELAMIVDLERNDLGRVCEYGSVRVTEPRVLEAYPTVFHLVATVEGELHEGRGIVDLLKATFPGGSITGAPKIRAMEIIDELEPTARNIYTGAIGYLDFAGRADLNIAIRTMLKMGDDVYFQAGGGIVADSDPESEYDETVDKARALIRALGAQEWQA